MSTTFRTTRRVEFRDTDAAGIVHFSVFFNYMEVAEHELWRHLGLSVKQTDGEDIISWPRVSAQCNYRHAVRFEDDLTIDVGIDRIGGKSVTFHFVVSREDVEVAHGSFTVVCCRIPKDGPPESMAIPGAIRAKLESLSTTA